MGLIMKFLIIILVTITLTACNTIGGFGKDIQGAAEYTSNKIGSQPEQKGKQ